VSGATDAGSTSLSGGIRRKTRSDGRYRNADSQRAFAEPYAPLNASAPTANPPRPGPTMRATRSAVRYVAFAAVSSSGSTSAGTTLKSAVIPQMTSSVPSRKVTA